MVTDKDHSSTVFYWGIHTVTNKCLILYYISNQKCLFFFLYAVNDVL